MGQTQSTDTMNDIKRQIGLIIQACSDDKWVPDAMSGFIVLNKRPDGSSVKELYIPQWNVSFFYSGSTISVRKQTEALQGKPVHLIVAHAILLHNLLIKSIDYLNAGEIAKDAFATYLGSSDTKN
jgi:hypothetical protein